MFGVDSYVNCCLQSIGVVLPEHRIGWRRVKECEWKWRKTSNMDGTCRAGVSGPIQPDRICKLILTSKVSSTNLHYCPSYLNSLLHLPPVFPIPPQLGPPTLPENQLTPPTWAFCSGPAEALHALAWQGKEAGGRRAWRDQPPYSALHTPGTCTPLALPSPETLSLPCQYYQ